MEAGDPEQKRKMRSLMEYFHGRHSFRGMGDFPHVTRELIREESTRRGAPWHWAVGNGSSFQGHMVIDYAKILRIGIPGLRREIEEAMSACDDPEKAPFYRSLLLYCDNMSDLCHRYAEKARDILAEEASESRRDELSEIAEICDSVSMRPPRSFREALQLFWFTFLLDGNDDPGRFDQFMFPFYRDDLAKGVITREFARELLEELWHKMEQVRAWSLVLAGQTPDGEDASNDLTHLCLEVTADLRITNPAVALRLFSGSPRHLWRMAMR